jgi:hypothetical protein
MKAHDRSYIRPVDVQAALARAHADRAEYIRLAFAEVPALFKRLAGKARRQRQPRNGALA